MARPRITIGIQPNTAMFSVVVGSVCAFAWYTEKYRRDEGELEGHLRKVYLRDAQDSQARMPQMTAAIKGQAMDLDGRMDKLVWGGKAQLKHNNTNKKPTTASLGRDQSESDDSDASKAAPEQKTTRKKRKKRKKKEKTNDEEKRRAEELERRKLVLQSSVAGVAVGAVAVAAVTTLLGGSVGRK